MIFHLPLLLQLRKLIKAMIEVEQAKQNVKTAIESVDGAIEARLNRKVKHDCGIKTIVRKG
jgi:hypothetical protein